MASPGVAYIPEQLANWGTQGAPECESISRNWYAIKTKHRQEQRAYQSIVSKGIEALYPQWPRDKANPNFHRPMFPGYVLARFNTDRHFAQINYAHGVSYVLSMTGQPVAIQDELIEVIKRNLDPAGYVLTPQLKAEDRVIVTAGPFAELEGTFMREMSGGERAIVLIRTIEKTWKCELPMRHIRKA